MIALVTGSLAIFAAVVVGGWRYFCIYSENRGLRSHVPMGWYSPGTRLGSWLVVFFGSLWAAYAFSLFVGALTNDWAGGGVFVATLGLRWTLSALTARVFLAKAIAGKF